MCDAASSKAVVGLAFILQPPLEDVALRVNPFVVARKVLTATLALSRSLAIEAVVVKVGPFLSWLHDDETPFLQDAVEVGVGQLCNDTLAG